MRKWPAALGVVTGVLTALVGWKWWQSALLGTLIGLILGAVKVYRHSEGEGRK